MSSSSSLICFDRPQREVTFLIFFNYSMQMSYLISWVSFSSFKFLWGFIQNSLLPLQHMKLGRKAHLAAASFMKYLFHTDARLWALLCCQTLIPALLLHFNWDTSRGDMYIWVCVHLETSAVNYTAGVCVCVCVLVLVPLYRVQRDGSRLLHVLPQQHLAMRAVQICYLDAGRSWVCPVQFVMDPVYGQST